MNCRLQWGTGVFGGNESKVAEQAQPDDDDDDDEYRIDEYYHFVRIIFVPPWTKMAVKW